MLAAVSALPQHLDFEASPLKALLCSVSNPQSKKVHAKLSSERSVTPPNCSDCSSATSADFVKRPMTSTWLLALVAGLAILSSWTSGAPSQIPDPNSLPDVTLNIQTKKLTSLVDERFLSMTVDPEQLIRHTQPGPGALRMLSMVSAMSPAYLRVAGPSTEIMGYEGSPGHVGDAITVNDQHWSHLQELCRTAGLRAIIALSARRRPGGGSRWDSRDAMRILGAIDASSVAPAGWQFGYDWTTLRTVGVTPSQATADIHTLKTLIEEFPILAKEAQLLLGPDADATNPDAEATSELTKGMNVGAVVIRPFTADDPTGTKVDKDFVHKVLGRNQKRPLWIAESGLACTAPFSSALLWAQRLCTATRLGAQVILREIDLDAAREKATPDFWVSLLHKTLTSRGILEARENGPEAYALSVSAHCTPSNNDQEPPKKTPIPKAIRYDLGAVTIMAANPTNRALRLSVDIARSSGIGSLTTDEVGTIVHEYVLTAPNNHLNATSTLLNGSPLELAAGGSIPVLSPRILKVDTTMTVLIPPQSVAFWVIPGAKARACTTPPASSDVAPAASRLQPFSARSMEIGVHLDDHSPLSLEPEQPEAEQLDDHSGESEENPVTKDIRRRRQRINARTSGVQRLSLPRPALLPRRPSLDLNTARSGKDEESKTLDDYIKEELRRKPSRVRANDPLRLLSLPSLDTSHLTSLPSAPPLPQLDLSAIELPALPAILSLPQIDSTTLFDPMKLNSDLQKMNSDLQRNLVQSATSPIRNLVKITDGLLDQIQGEPRADRRKRSAEGQTALAFDEDLETARFEMFDDPTRSKRKTVLDYVKEELQRKHKKAPPEKDAEPEKPGSEDSSREGSRTRRFAPEDLGIKSKRKPVVPDFVSLPRLPKKPLLPSAAAKRTHLLLSQSKDEGGSSPNSWGTTHREMFPQGDVFAETEEASDGRDPNVDYVMDDDFEPADPKTPASSQIGPETDALYYAPGEFYETYGSQTPRALRKPLVVGEFGELEHFPGSTPPAVKQRRTSVTVPSRVAEKDHLFGKIAPSFDDSTADSFKIVPAEKPNKEKEAEIQSKLRKRLEEHYAEVQKAALDRKAEFESDEEDVPEDKVDMDSLQALAERYRQEKKLNSTTEVPGNANRLQKQDEPKEAEKKTDEKSRRRRDVGGVLKTDPPKGEGQKNDESAEVVKPEVAPETKGLPIKKASDSHPETHNTAQEIKEKRLEKIKAFRDKMKMSNDRPHLPLKGKLGHESQVITSNRHKRGARYEESFPLEGALRDVIKQIDREEVPYRPAPWDSTRPKHGFSKIPEPKQEDLSPSSRYRDSFDETNRRSFETQDLYGPPYLVDLDYMLPPFRPDYQSRPPPFKPEPDFYRPGFVSRPSHGFGSYPSLFDDSSEMSWDSSEEWHTGRKHKNHYQNDGFLTKSAFDFDPKLDLPDDVGVEDFSIEMRAALPENPHPQRSPNVVAVPWETSFPSSVRFKRSVDTGVTNTIVQTDSKQKSQEEMAEAIRQLHKILNDNNASSGETSVEVNRDGRLIDSPETLDSLEDTIQNLLSMTKNLNDTLNHHDEIISWSDFGMNDTQISDPQLDPEEMKFKDAAMAWIQGVKTGAFDKSPKEKGESDSSSHHASVKKQLPDEEKSSAYKELTRQHHLSEQENIVTAMMQRVAALLSQLRTILNKKETDEDRT